MSMLLEEPDVSIDSEHDSSQRLRNESAAVRLSFNWFGTSKSLSPQQKALAADTFGAEGKYLSAGKKLLDTSHPAFRQVTSIRGRALSLWKGMTLPFPEPGIRLIRRDRINAFTEQMDELQRELSRAVRVLDDHYDELRRSAQQRLGSLYSPSDYPSSLEGMFAISWDFPSVEPPDYLRQLSPSLYRRECERVQARFDHAVALAEQAFTEELHRLVSHLRERLSGSEDGKPKVFRDSAVGNLTEFFQRFRELNLHSDRQLDELVDHCQSVVRGIEPQRLRDNLGIREHVAEELQQVQTVLDDLLVDRPRRNILRRRK